MNDNQKANIEKIIYYAVLLATAGLSFFGFDTAGMALCGILMLVYGVKSIRENKLRAVLLLAVGMLLFTVALLLRFGVVS
jgi:hypothetical protein